MATQIRDEPVLKCESGYGEKQMDSEIFWRLYYQDFLVFYMYVHVSVCLCVDYDKKDRNKDDSKFSDLSR